MLGPVKKPQSNRDHLDDEITLQDIFQVILRIFRQWPYLLGAGAVGLVAALIINLFLVDQYKMEAQINIEISENPLANAESILNRQFGRQASGILGTRLAVLKSYAHNENVARSLQWYGTWIKPGVFKDTEVRLPKGYSLEVDTSVAVPYRAAINVHFVPGGVEIGTKGKQEVSYYSYGNERYQSTSTLHAQPKVFYPFDSWVEGDLGKWRIVRKANTPPLQEEMTLLLQFNTHDKVAAWGRSLLSISADEKSQSNLVNLSMEGPLKQKLVDYINVTVEELQRYELEQKNVMALNTVNFIDSQLKQIESSLRTSEQALEDFRSENLIVDLSAESAQMLDYMISLEQEGASLKLQRSFYQYVLEFLQTKQSYTGLSLPSFSSFDDPLVVQLAEQLVESSVELERYKYSLEGSNPAVIELEREVEYTKQALLNATRNALSSSAIVLEDLTDRITQAQGKIAKLPATEQQLINIQRTYEISGGQYELLLEKRAEAGILQASNLPDTKIIDRAVDRGQPKTGPNRLLYLLAGGFAGVVLCAGFFLLKDSLNTKVLSPEDIERNTDIPVLGVIPHTDHPSNLIVLEEPNSIVAESFRGLRVNLRFLLHNKTHEEGTVLAITSSVSSEGKTFVSKNLASVLSLGQDRVVLVEMDLRKPKIFYDFNLEKDVALKDYLAGLSTEEEIVQKTQYRNLDVISASTSPPNPAELLQNDRFEALLTSLRKRYKYVILDTPPIAMVADALQILPFVDATLYLARSGQTKGELLGIAENHYQKGFLSNVGIVLNDIEAKKGYGYSYNYGYQAYGRVG